MFPFFKAQAASLTASLVDLLVTIIFVTAFQTWYVGGAMVGTLAGSMMGTLAGGITHFTMCRKWVFDAGGKKITAQIMRYIIVWNGNLLLTTLGVYMITHHFGLNYAISKILISAIVGVSYNYLLQKNFVFK